MKLKSLSNSSSNSNSVVTTAVVGGGVHNSEIGKNKSSVAPAFPGAAAAPALSRMGGASNIKIPGTKAAPAATIATTPTGNSVLKTSAASSAMDEERTATATAAMVRKHITAEAGGQRDLSASRGVEIKN